MINKIKNLIIDRKFQRFFIVGVIAFIVDTLVLNLVKFRVFNGNNDTLLGLISYPKLMSSSVGVVVSFFLNRYWAFQAKEGKIHEQASKFLAVFVLNIFISSIIFNIFENVLEKMTLAQSLASFIPTISNILTTGIIMFISFFFYTNFIFNARESKPNYK